jgi:hypothetical protein
MKTETDDAAHQLTVIVGMLQPGQIISIFKPQPQGARSTTKRNRVHTLLQHGCRCYKEQCAALCLTQSKCLLRKCIGLIMTHYTPESINVGRVAVAATAL